MAYRHILLIDDDESDQRIFSMVLRGIDPAFSCTIIDDAAQALDKLVTAELSVDFIFLDMRMPGMNGTEFLRELQGDAKLRQIPVVILSGLPNEADKLETQKLGARDYVVKPGKYSELKSILSSHLR